jgi:hypothetical protein
VYLLSDFLNVSFLWFLFHLLLFAAAEAGKKLTCGRQARAERQITISLRLGAFARKKHIAPLEQKDYPECVFY